LTATFVFGLIAATLADPVETKAAETTYDEYAGYYYLAKGETVTIKDTSYPGKLSIVSKGGNTIKISGKKIKVTGKKSGLIVVKAGETKIGFHVYIGGNNKDSKVKYSEYALKFTDNKKSYTNYIDCIRYRMKKNKGITYIGWEDEADNKEIKSANRGAYIGETIYDINSRYPSWCDYDGWTEENGEEYLCVQCALYYDKTSNCVFYKRFYGPSSSELISGVEWGCWKNNRVLTL
jgi:hypothetical protein